MDRRKDEIGCPLFLFPAAVVALNLKSGGGHCGVSLPGCVTWHDSSTKGRFVGFHCDFLGAARISGSLHS